MASNVTTKLEAYLPRTIFDLLQSIGKEASKRDQDAYIVGGIVRDLFLGRPNSDIDIAIQRNAISLARKLARDSTLPLTEHAKFGTATLTFDSFSIDMATTRSETYPRPGALPTVDSGTITDDLRRRDFSINAMAVYISPKRFGELVDKHGGIVDIKNKCIRILHEHSFIDDATRIFRAIRYEQRLNFTIEETTLRTLKRDLDYIDTISGDRIRHEIDLIFQEKQPELMLARACDLGVLRKLHNNLNDTGLWNHTFRLARKVHQQELSLLYWCLFLYGLTDPESNAVVTRLNLSKAITKTIHESLLLKSRLTDLNSPEIRSSDIDHLLHRYTSAAIEANLVAAESPAVRRNLKQYLSELRYVKCFLDGDRLREIGVPAGAEIGRLLGKIHSAKLDGMVNTKKEEEELVYQLHPELRK